MRTANLSGRLARGLDAAVRKRRRPPRAGRSHAARGKSPRDAEPGLCDPDASERWRTDPPPGAGGGGRCARGARGRRVHHARASPGAGNLESQSRARWLALPCHRNRRGCRRCESAQAARRPGRCGVDRGAHTAHGAGAAPVPKVFFGDAPVLLLPRGEKHRTCGLRSWASRSRSSQATRNCSSAIPERQTLSNPSRSKQAHYRTQRLTVAPAQVDLSSPDLKRVDGEHERIHAALATYSSRSPKPCDCARRWPGARSSSFGLRRYFNGEPRTTRTAAWTSQRPRARRCTPPPRPW